MEYLYVCHFSNGHIKVGRSIDPKSRIAAHADRVACMGVELVEHQAFGCAGHPQPAEVVLIEQCTSSAKKRNKSEWFEGLDFMEVCEWAQHISVRQFPAPVARDVKPHKDNALITALGGAAKLAELLGYPSENGVQRVFNWSVRGIPASVKLTRPDLFLQDLVQLQREAIAAELVAPRFATEKAA